MLIWLQKVSVLASEHHKPITVLFDTRFDIRLWVAAQTAVISITANLPTNTRVKLICTDVAAVGAFTERIFIFFYTRNVF